MARPLEKVYAAIFIDAIIVKVRDGQVRNRPFYAAIGVDLDGHKDIGGRVAGSPSPSPAFPEAIVQTCIIHLIRNTVRYASRKYWDQISRDMKPIYTAPTATAARDQYEEFAKKWGTPYPAIKTLWEGAWCEFIPFLDYDVETRKVMCSTNAIESLNARYRRTVRARGHFPNEQSAMKTLYLVTRSLDPKSTVQRRWVTRWKPALNTFAINFADRMPTAENR